MRAPEFALAGRAARLDARSKLGAVLLAMVATLAFSDWPTMALVAALSAGFAAWGGFVPAWLRVLRSIWLLAVIVLVADVLYYGPAGGELALLKLLLLVSLFSSFFLSTDPDDLALALVAMKLPFTFAFVLAASANYVPLVNEEASEIAAAFQARGVSRGRTPLGALRFYASILVPLVVATIRRSLRLSEALEARAFGASKRRTSLKALRLDRADALLLAGATAGFALLLLLHVV